MRVEMEAPRYSTVCVDTRWSVIVERLWFRYANASTS